MSRRASHNLPEIDLVVCNLYPFEQTVAKPGVTEAEVIENIDIGGPCMIRAAAKNFESVAVATNEGDYFIVRLHMEANGGSLSLDTRRKLAVHAFEMITKYDAAIANYFDNTWTALDGNFGQPLTLILSPKQGLRYGENPHQHAEFYSEPAISRPCIATAKKLHGKELSYNNILDLDSALNLVREFPEPACVVVKHNNPCGAARAATLVDAFRAAWDGDPQSAFGGILAFNWPVDADTASAIMDPEAQRFIECIIAPEFDPPTLDALHKWKVNVRLLRTGELVGGPQGLDYRRVDGGLLVQTRDLGADNMDRWKVTTKRQPSDDELRALWFAWLVCKHAKSNAIVLASRERERPGCISVVGVGAGQMSRVDSVEMAVRKAGDRARGAVLASDAFFPFRDNVDAAAKAGVTAVVQPGGSVRDADSVAACDEHGLAMVFTGVRHFRH